MSIICLGHYVVSVSVCRLVSPHFNNDTDRSLSVSKQVTQNSTFHLRCPARAVPPPQITWYKNGHEIGAQTSDRIQSVHSLYLPKSSLYKRTVLSCLLLSVGPGADPSVQTVKGDFLSHSRR